MIITPRDRELFRHLSNYGMLSTKHIKEIVFGGIATTTVLRRLRPLEKQDYIKRLSGLESQDVLWILAQKSKKIGGGKQFKKFWNKNLLEHDFKLLNLRLELERQGIAKSWVPEHEIRYLIFKKYDLSIAKKKLIPDGLMFTHSNQCEVSVAIELELSLKNKERIKDTLTRYQQKKDLNYLWYICQDKTITRSILFNWIEAQGHNSSIKLYCSYFEEVMNNPHDANLFDGKQKIKLRELWQAQTAHPTAQRMSNPPLESPITPLTLTLDNRGIYPVSNAPPDTCLLP